MQRGYAGLIVHENEGTSHVHGEMVKLILHDEQEFLSLWKAGSGMTAEAGGWTPSCAPRQDVRRWSTFVVTRCTRECRERRACLRRRKTHQVRMGGDKGQPGKPNVRARWVAKEYKTRARPELYASTPPLETLKVVLSETATGKREGYVVALVDVRRAHFYAPARRRAFVELPPEESQAGNEHVCGLLQHSSYGTRNAAQNWEEELASTLSDLKLTRGIACPCVWQGCIKDEHIVATVHGDDNTIGGERSAVEFVIKMISRKHESEKQVKGEDADLEKSGRLLNRVIEWSRRITIEADHRHVREMLKDLELERANHSKNRPWSRRNENFFRIRNEGQAAQRQQRTHMLTEHEPASNDFRAMTAKLATGNGQS